jgi:RNA polymerase sigma-70 factor (sigma-E family)
MVVDASRGTVQQQPPMRVMHLVPNTASERRAAVVRCYEQHYADLLRLGCLLVGQRHTSEDLVHEAFVRLYADSERLSDPSKALAYLRRTVVNLARGRHRRSLVALKHEPPQPPPTASAEDAALGGLDKGEVVAALHRLPDRQRECLVLRHYLRMTEGEIANVLGVSVGSVRTHTKRGMAMLERHLGGLR